LSVLFTQANARRLRAGRDHILILGETRNAIDEKIEAPGTGSNEDSAFPASQTDGFGAGQFPGRKDRQGRHQQVAAKRQVESTLDKELPAIGGDDLSRLASQLKAVQTQAGRIAAGSAASIVKGPQKCWRHPCQPVCRWRQGWYFFGIDGVEVRHLGNATILPAGFALAGLQFQDHRCIPAAFELPE
jgi:hypothetical protein